MEGPALSDATSNLRHAETTSVETGNRSGNNEANTGTVVNTRESEVAPHDPAEGLEDYEEYETDENNPPDIDEMVVDDEDSDSGEGERTLDEYVIDFNPDAKTTAHIIEEIKKAGSARVNRTVVEVDKERFMMLGSDMQELVATHAVLMEMANNGRSCDTVPTAKSWTQRFESGGDQRLWIPDLEVRCAMVVDLEGTPMRSVAYTVIAGTDVHLDLEEALEKDDWIPYAVCPLESTNEITPLDESNLKWVEKKTLTIPYADGQPIEHEFTVGETDDGLPTDVYLDIHALADQLASDYHGGITSVLPTFWDRLYDAYMEVKSKLSKREKVFTPGPLATAWDKQVLLDDWPSGKRRTLDEHRAYTAKEVVVNPDLDPSSTSQQSDKSPKAKKTKSKKKNAAKKIVLVKAHNTRASTSTPKTPTKKGTAEATLAKESAVSSAEKTNRGRRTRAKLAEPEPTQAPNPPTGAIPDSGRYEAQRGSRVSTRAIARERARQETSDPRLLQAIDAEIDAIFDAQVKSTADNKAYANNNVLRVVRNSLSKALQSYRVKGSADDQLPSKAVILALRYCNPSAGLTAEIAGILAQMNRLDLAQVGVMQAAGPRSYNAFEGLVSKEMDAVTARVSVLEKKATTGTDASLKGRVEALEANEQNWAKQSYVNELAAKIKGGIQASVNARARTQEVADLKTEFAKHVEASSKREGALTKTVKDLEARLEKLEKGKGEAPVPAPPATPSGPRARRAGLTPNKRAATPDPPGSAHKRARVGEYTPTRTPRAPAPSAASLGTSASPVTSSRRASTQARKRKEAEENEESVSAMDFTFT